MPADLDHCQVHPERPAVAWRPGPVGLCEDCARADLCLDGPASAEESAARVARLDEEDGDVD